MSKRLTHHAIVAQGNRRNHPIPPSIQCLIQEGIISSGSTLDRTGNYTTTNNNINYDSSQLYKQLPTILFAGSSYFDVPIDINNFNGVIGCRIKPSFTGSNEQTVWGNDAGSFGYGLHFFTGDRHIRYFTGAAYYDTSLILNSGWNTLITILTPTKFIAQLNNKTETFNRQINPNRTFVRVGTNAWSGRWFQGNLQSFWIS